MAVSDIAEGGGKRTRRTILVAVSAEVIWQITSKALSSPQTAELDAEARAPTIWKWVKIAGWESGAWITFLCILDGSLWPAVGGAAAGVPTYLQYRYAMQSGLNGGSRPGGGYGGQH